MRLFGSKKAAMDNDVPVVRRKKKFTFSDFINSFNSLDSQNMGNWPNPVKLTIYFFVMALTLLLAYFVVIRPVLDEIDNARAQEENLLSEYRSKDSKLRNLKLYQRQVEEMEFTFGELLQQLPKETEIPGLVEDINFTGVSSGLRFNNIKVQPEVKQDFFIELPISIEAQGDYHAFGAFTSGLAALPRIVTIHDFTIEALPEAQTKSEIPVLKMTVNAKTYRYNEQAQDDKAKIPAGKNGQPTGTNVKTGATS